MSKPTSAGDALPLMRSERSEEPPPGGLQNLDVDHILPESWFGYWTLPDGEAARANEAQEAQSIDSAGEELSDRQIAILQRDRLKKTVGNLTLLHYGLNRSLQNREFDIKREKLFAESNLHLNRELMRLPDWNETRIRERGRVLFETALRLWPGPPT